MPWLFLVKNETMENLLHNLKTLLQKDERLVSEGELLKNKIIELALKLDRELIRLLLSDEKMKGVFFADVGEVLIFDKDKFVRFVSCKDFLKDSYTAFKNNIGLTVDNEFLSGKKEVVLSWPYKDCVLEGGMTKEDQKREEIFWNEILAPDEISRLLDPKVFTNAKRIDKNGPASAKATAGRDELKKLWETMKEKAFLSYKVDIKAVDENAKDFADLSIKDQKKFLLECLDKNHLYVNYSEIDDEEYGVSEEDKKINRNFYSDEKQ